MTLKVTERDKKLLVFLAIFVVVVGLGAGVILPLLSKSQELREELTQAQLEQTEKEQKVLSLSTMEKRKKEAEASLEEMKKEFYGVMQSKDIDKMLTEMALSNGVVVNEMDIAMPSLGEYTQLTDYSKMLIAAALNNEEGTQDKEEAPSYGGVYTAQVEMTMTGGRVPLQAVLDNCASQEPKMRIAEFLWQGDKKNEGTYTLAIKLELYMAEDTQEYLLEQMERKAVEKAEENADAAEK